MEWERWEGIIETINGDQSESKKMISHKHKCIFVHLPKVAGGSIERGITDKGWAFVRKNGFKVRHENRSSNSIG